MHCRPDGVTEYSFLKLDDEGRKIVIGQSLIGGVDDVFCQLHCRAAPIFFHCFCNLSCAGYVINSIASEDQVSFLGNGR